MSIEKTFDFVGVARRFPNSAFQVRWGNSERWGAVIHAFCYDVDIIACKHPMTKVEALEYLLDINFANGNKQVLECLKNTLAKRPKAIVRVKKDPFADVDAVLAQAAVEQELDKDLEDAPY